MKKKMFNIKHPKRPLLALQRALKFGMSSLSRNKFLTISTIVLIAVIIFIFNIFLTINFVIKYALNDLTQRVDLVVYLKSDIKYHQVQDIMNELKEQKGIIDVEYTSRNEALEIVSKTHPETVEILKTYEIENPLPPSLNVITEKPEYHIMVQQFLNQEKYRSLISQDLNAEEKVAKANEIVSKNLTQLSRVTNQIIFWILIIFIIGTFVIIINAIQLTIYSRKKEIYIMRLVGATRNFIRLPFLFEGLFYAFIATFISFGIYALIANQINMETISFGIYFNQIPLQLIALIEFIVIAMFGLISSFIAVQQYLHTKLILNK